MSATLQTYATERKKAPELAEPCARIGVQGSASYGAALARHLVAAFWPGKGAPRDADPAPLDSGAGRERLAP